MLNGGVHLRLRTPFSYLENGWTDCAENWCVIRGLLAIHFAKDGDIFPSARVNVHTFKHIYPLPLVHRPKGAFLVLYFPINIVKIAVVADMFHALGRFIFKRQFWQSIMIYDTFEYFA